MKTFYRHHVKQKGSERREEGQKAHKEYRKDVCQGKGKQYNRWVEERMRGALGKYRETVERGLKANVRFLVRAWDIPRATLRRRISRNIAGIDHSFGQKPILPDAAEKELATVLKLMSERGFPLTKKDVQQLAFQYAKENNISGFSQKTGKAGCYWFQNFLKRNANLSMRKPEALSAARAAGLNEQVLSYWFHQYEIFLKELGIEDNPSHLCSLSENGWINADLFLEWGQMFLQALPEKLPCLQGVIWASPSAT